MARIGGKFIAGSMSKALLVTALVVLPSVARGQDDYLGHIEGAIVGIEQRDYNRAAESLKSALALDANDPLSHLCLATIYAHTGRVEQAEPEYRAALAASGDDPLAAYGLGVILLSRRNTAGAAERFRRLHEQQPADAVPVLAYIKALAGRYAEASKMVEGLKDPASLQVRGSALFKAGKLSEARHALSDLVETLPSRGCDEPAGAVMTFEPWRPVRFTGAPLAKPIAPPLSQRDSARKVSGTTTLRADLTRARGVSFVLFFVDERMVGLVNHPPYEYPWDTTRYSNGLHTVRIQGQTAGNQVISQKSMRVLVENPGAKAYARAGPEVEALRARLWNVTRLSPSVAAAHYLLAKCAIGALDRIAAETHLERVMAANPDYLNTRSLLKQIYCPTGKFRELRRGPVNGGKIIALTFDDGPNAMTARILDVLSQERVKATFFVVGRMCEQNPGVVERMQRDGHEIENHTYSHRNLKYLPVSEIEKELFKTIAVLRDLVGKRSTRFRPPGGHVNGNVRKVAADYGLEAVYWTANCGSYEGTTTGAIAKYISSAATPGGVVLMHNVEDVTLAALPAAIRSLKAKGYRFATVSEMFSGGVKK